MNVIDLFCGCGGLTYGLKKAGLNILAGIDNCPEAIESYKANFDHLAICKDLSIFPPENLGIKETDIIVGGPPCQGFSIAGKRDAKDPRNSLFMEFVKYLNYYNPKAFLMENVMGILSAKNENQTLIIDIIMEFLNKNYNCVICKLMASDFEVPQNRKRVIIIGLRKDLNKYPYEPKIVTINRIPVKNVLEPKEQVDKKQYLSEKAIIGIYKKKEKSKNEGKGFGAQFLDFEKPSYTIPARYYKDGYDALVKYNDTEIRRLTLLELKRIQTFPDNFILCGKKKDQIIQIGNAVACNFAYYLGLHLINLLN